MKILLLGKNGQVGWELNRSLLPLGELVSLDRSQCDLSRPEMIPQIVQSINPDVIVNAAAYTAVDKAEEEEELATIINGVSVGVIAEEAKKRDALLIHYSTDYVFDGSKKNPYTEEDKPNPINAYGRSKLAGENLIKNVNCNHLILRTSWVYSSRGNNFLKTILKLSQEKDELHVVSDQFGVPTSAELVADITAQVLQQLFAKPELMLIKKGVYNLTAEGKTSWFEFAQHILRLAIDHNFSVTLSPEQLHPKFSENKLSAAARPLNSCLDTSKLQSSFKLVLPKWESAIEGIILSAKL